MLSVAHAMCTAEVYTRFVDSITLVARHETQLTFERVGGQRVEVAFRSRILADAAATLIHGCKVEDLAAAVVKAGGDDEVARFYFFLESA